MQLQKLHFTEIWDRTRGRFFHYKSLHLMYRKRAMINCSWLVTAPLEFMLGVEEQFLINDRG